MTEGFGLPGAQISRRPTAYPCCKRGLVRKWVKKSGLVIAEEVHLFVEKFDTDGVKRG